jgi:hypothetical protein
MAKYSRETVLRGSQGSRQEWVVAAPMLTVSRPDTSTTSCPAQVSAPRMPYVHTSGLTASSGASMKSSAPRYRYVSSCVQSLGLDNAGRAAGRIVRASRPPRDRSLYRCHPRHAPSASEQLTQAQPAVSQKLAQQPCPRALQPRRLSQHPPPSSPLPAKLSPARQLEKLTLRAAGSKSARPSRRRSTLQRSP